MIRILILFILLGGAAMANQQGLLEQNPTAPIDPEEQFWNSEEGRDIERLFNEVQSGKKSMEQAREEYNKRWAGKPASGAQSVPEAPLNRIR